MAPAAVNASTASRSPCHARVWQALLLSRHALPQASSLSRGGSTPTALNAFRASVENNPFSRHALPSARNSSLGRLRSRGLEQIQCVVGPARFQESIPKGDQLASVAYSFADVHILGTVSSPS